MTARRLAAIMFLTLALMGAALWMVLSVRQVEVGEGDPFGSHD